MASKFPNNAFVPLKSGTGLRLVVAEAPGEDESVQLEPLVGGSGRRFDALCRAAGVSRHELTLCNTISCRPPQNVYPSDSDARAYISQSEAKAAIAQCYRNHLEPVLKSRPWKRIDILGDKALQALSGLSPITRYRGTCVPIRSLDDKLIGMPTLHPAYVARDQDFSKVVINDLAKSLVQAPEDYNLYPDLAAVERLIGHDTFSFDIENDPRTLEIRMVGITVAPYSSVCVPFRGAYIPLLKQLFREARNVIGQNSLQHDEWILKLHDVRINEDATHYDIMLMQHLLMPNLPHDLGFIASIFVNKPAWKHQHHDNEELYNCRDTDVTFQIWQQLLPLLKKEKLLNLYLNVQVPLARICLLMKQTGIKVDPARIAAVREKLTAEMVKLEVSLPLELRTHEEEYNKREPAPKGTLSEKTGKPLKFITVKAYRPVVPWRSNDVLSAYLYDKLGLPKQLHAKSGEVTVDKSALDKLYRRTKRPELATLRAIKKLSTLLSGFATEELSKVAFQYPHFNVHGTASGRLSSSDPNLQNIPESARFLYVPRHPDWEFLEVDYSGIENRITAYLAGDTPRLAKFETIPGYSEHKFAVEVFFGIPYDEVEKDNDKEAPYGKAKRIVHGVNYGMGARKIANLYDLDEKEVKVLIAKWKSAIDATTQWQLRTAEQAKQTGYLTTPFNRKRWFYTDSYYTESLSFIPQSTAADVIFRSMIGLMYERIGLSREQAQLVCPVVEPLPKPALLVLQVHDSNLFEYPREMRDEVCRIVRKVFTQPWPELGGFSIPIGMVVGASSWGELEPYETR